MAWILLFATALAQTVTLPLTDWEALEASAQPDQIEAPREAPVQARRVVGRLERGLLEARLTTHFDALQDEGPLDVALLGSTATVVQTRLDGLDISVQHEGDLLVTSVSPGPHVAEIDLLAGRRTDRFARRVQLSLPPGGPTEVEIWVPELPITAQLAHGVVASTSQQEGGTLVRGWLDGSGELDLTWQRQLPEIATRAARTEVSVNVLYELGEDVIDGNAAFSFDIVDGRADRLDLQLPDDLEVLGVGGKDVLQWHTEADGTLAILLRHLATGEVDAEVRFQYPADLEAAVPLRLPLPDSVVSGALGVRAPVGLSVALEEIGSATALSHRDMPTELLDLTPDPIRVAVAFEEAPAVQLAVERHADLSLSVTRIDDIQALTVLGADGTETGKLRMRIRNSARQNLGVKLPDGAGLTHCFRDGVALRPGRDPTGRLVVPLSLSERTAPGEDTTWVVRDGDTLSGIAQKQWGDASRWPEIVRANSHLDSGHMLVAGRPLVLPATAEEPLERTVVMELAWRRQTPAPGRAGQRTVALPELDIEVLSTTWHLYLPEGLEPLSMKSNLPQRSRVHYLPVTSLLRWLVPDALAGLGYKSILSKRRSIYAEEKAAAADQLVSTFPLVGLKYRFGGVLLGTDNPQVTVRYVDATFAKALRWLMAFLAASLAFWISVSPRSNIARGAVVLGSLGVLVGGGFLLGATRMALQGACAGMALVLAGRVYRARLDLQPWDLLPGVGRLALGLLAWIALMVVSTVPPLVPVAMCAALAIATWRTS